MIPVIMVEPPQSPTPAHFRSFEEADSKYGMVFTLPNKRIGHLIERTAAIPDTPVVLTYAVATSTSLPDRLSGLSVQIKIGRDDVVPSMLAQIRRITGWPWERLASALGRSRQAVHGWTLGREITQENFERLAKLRATIAYIDRGSVEENRILLGMTRADGKIVADLIDDGKFEDVRALCGRGGGAREDISKWTKKAEQVRDSEVSRNGHWVDQLVETGGEEIPFEYITLPGERRRITVQRRG